MRLKQVMTQNPQHKVTNTQTYALLVILAIVTAIVLLTVFLTEHTLQKTEAITTEARTTPALEVFQPVVVQARAAIVWDVKNKTALYQKNDEAQLPLASLTKIMTALVARESVGGNLLVSVDDADIAAEGDSGLISGDTFSLNDLLSYTLLVSSNDGAEAIASAAGAFNAARGDGSREERRDSFIERMNIRARELGLVQTFFTNPTGLDSSLYASGGYGSARDMAQLFARAVQAFPNIFEATAYSTLSFETAEHRDIEGENTNEALGKIPNFIAGKTGYTDLAGGNLVVAFNAGLDRPIVVVVLGSTYDGRFTDVATLSEAALKAIAFSH